jgi:2,3-bisphosphoglycerate-independent phosphoglycerate mutase
MNKKLLLVILDGWGISDQVQYSAISQAKTPFINGLYQKFPHTTLEASGMAVGLPEGQMGNSEVGHMHIGGGRVIPQSLVRINQAIESGELAHNKTLTAAFEYAKKQHKAIHLMGLVSDGGIHSHLNHLKALCTIAKDHELKDVFIHAFTDGRDTDPHSGIYFLGELVKHAQHTTGRLASITGRYYSMDRDCRWERVQVAYDALVHGQGIKTKDWNSAVQQAYSQGITDEFIQPIVITNQADMPVARIQAGDVIICFNFRTDRSRQLTQVLTQAKRQIPGMNPLALYYLTLTVYDESFQGIHPIFDKQIIKNTLGEALSKHGKTQLRIAETEKYPHVTYFFSGGKEAPFLGEERILCASPSVSTYDQQPEMAAYEVTDQTIAALQKKSYDFLCINFANPDMVGHTGNWHATIKACEVVDACVERVVGTALANHYATLIVADHGNAEQMFNPSGNPYTAHTTNPVPCILVDHDYQGALYAGNLTDIAPTILQCMGLPVPEEMTGRPLFEKGR